MKQSQEKVFKNQTRGTETQYALVNLNEDRYFVAPTKQSGQVNLTKNQAAIVFYLPQTIDGNRRLREGAISVCVLNTESSIISMIDAFRNLDDEIGSKQISIVMTAHDSKMLEKIKNWLQANESRFTEFATFTTQLTEHSENIIHIIPENKLHNLNIKLSGLSITATKDKKIQNDLPHSKNHAICGLFTYFQTKKLKKPQIHQSSEAKKLLDKAH